MIFAQPSRSTFPFVAFISLVLAALFLGMPAFAAGKTAAVSEFTLANGLDVVVIPDHRAPIVTHMVWYKAGSADEAPGKSGIAHFF
jgi:zinc protease